MNIWRSRLLPAIMIFFFILEPGLLAQRDREQEERLRQEESVDYYGKWLNEDIKYIISDEERSVFNSLTTPEEKEQFIEQFWFRRDPDPRSAENEFKIEHYRRIAYSNEKFTSGDPGWMTDRGKVYITWGPPANIMTRPTGGFYVRPIEEGGGTTTVYPYEKWTYHFIEGLGPNVEMEFVDPTESGEYKLAVYDWEKDSGTFHPGVGQTLDELMGTQTRADRAQLTPATGGAQYSMRDLFRRRWDNPFNRYERYATVMSSPITKYQDLQEIVKVRIDYHNLPFELKEDYFKLNEERELVPITLQVKHRDLTFKKEGQFNVARMAIYGLVQSLTNRVIAEFEDDLVIRYTDDELEKGLLKSAVYQKVLLLERKLRYKVDFVVKETNSGKTGIIRKAIVPPPYKGDSLQVSTMLLSDQIEVLTEIPDQDEMFVIGDVRILPRLSKQFNNTMPLGVYLQVYNAELDQSTLEPALKIIYTLSKDGETIQQIVDEDGQSMQFFSGRRVVLMKNLSLSGLKPGKYRVEVDIEDALKDEEINLRDDFEVIPLSL
ncbi:MAG: GWxTD domain-containing protein [Acidobacteriota bacterium]